MPVIVLISVDFPAPFSPTRAWTSPANSSMPAPSSARVAPKRLCTPSSAIRAGTMFPLDRRGTRASACTKVIYRTRSYMTLASPRKRPSPQLDLIAVGIEAAVARVQFGDEDVDAAEVEAARRRPVPELRRVDGQHDLGGGAGERQLGLGVEQRRLARPELGVERRSADEEPPQHHVARRPRGQRADEAPGRLVELATGQQRRNPGMSL